ncbi:MAG: hypothetical protein ACSLFM_03950 [Tepidiformaceae bacterium]
MRPPHVLTTKYTIADFNRNFTDEDTCLEYVKDMVYPDGIVCRRAGSSRNFPFFV